MIFRILAIGTYTLPDTKYSVVYRVTCYSSVSLFFGLLQPYKESWINNLDSIAFMLFSLAEFVTDYDEHMRFHFSFAYGLAVVPLVYLIVYTSYKLLSQMAVLRRCALCCKNHNDEDRRALSAGEVEREAYTDSQEGEPLLTTASDLGGRY